jgi:glycerate-2-kinase
MILIILSVAFSNKLFDIFIASSVTISGKGLGDRNQALCLAAAIAISGMENVVILSTGTDGPTDVDGGIIDSTTIERAKKSAMNAAEFLKNNDSYHFLQKIGDLLITVPTNTNVMDIQIILLGRKRIRK